MLVNLGLQAYYTVQLFHQRNHWFPLSCEGAVSSPLRWDQNHPGQSMTTLSLSGDLNVVAFSEKQCAFTLLEDLLGSNLVHFWQCLLLKTWCGDGIQKAKVILKLFWITSIPHSEIWSGLESRGNSSWECATLWPCSTRDWITWPSEIPTEAGHFHQGWHQKGVGKVQNCA